MLRTLHHPTTAPMMALSELTARDTDSITNYLTACQGPLPSFSGGVQKISITYHPRARKVFHRDIHSPLAQKVFKPATPARIRG
jgi:hypothetical protein